MDKHGKKYDVLIEDVTYTDRRTGMEITPDWFDVWADAGMKEAIKKVVGVTHVFTNDGPTKYGVHFDPRYDREFIKREIEAVILCAGDDNA